MKMKGTTQKMFILAVGVIVFVLIAGCQESATGGPTDAKKSRLIAAQNMELKKELEQRSKEIERLKELHSKEIKRQEGLLAKCHGEKKLWQDKADENIKEQVGEILAATVELNSKLQEENESLKAQIEKLKAEPAKNQQGEKPKE
jgi:outer membrane murein-binding lipoprotein Lpp